MKHLFVLSPHNSGSTLLAHTVRRCKNASTFNNHFCESSGLKGFNQFAPTASTRITSPHRYQYDWSKLWKLMHDNWDLDKSVLFDKCPVHGLFNADMLAKFGDDVNFIVLMRNPYAYCEGVVRRTREQNLKISISSAANFWLKCAEQQIQNFLSAESAICLSYESICEDPQGVEEIIRDFVPELQDFNFQGEYSIASVSSHAWQTNPLKNFNVQQIARLSVQDLDEISDVLEQAPSVMNFWEYKII